MEANKDKEENWFIAKVLEKIDFEKKTNKEVLYTALMNSSYEEVREKTHAVLMEYEEPHKIMVIFK